MKIPLKRNTCVSRYDLGVKYHKTSTGDFIVRKVSSTRLIIAFLMSYMKYKTAVIIKVLLSFYLFTIFSLYTSVIFTKKVIFLWVEIDNEVKTLKSYGIIVIYVNSNEIENIHKSFMTSTSKKELLKFFQNLNFIAVLLLLHFLFNIRYLKVDSGSTQKKPSHLSIQFKNL